MDHRPVNPIHSDGPPVPQAQALSTSSVALPISARQTHRRPRTVDQMSPSGCTTDASSTRPTKKNTREPCWHLKTGKVTWVTKGRILIEYDERNRAAPTTEQHSALANDIGHVVRAFCPILWKSWKAMPEETKITVRNQLFTNYNLEHMDEDKFAYVNRLFSERYKQWKSDLHQWFQEFDDPQVALEEGCPNELEDRQDRWVWLCGHFKDLTYVKKAKANKINREKKTLLHHSGSRPFSYRMEARRKEGSKFPEIDVFANVYVRSGNELVQSLHATMVEKRQVVLQESASNLPSDTPIESVDPPVDAGFHIVTETLDQTFGRRLGTYCREMGNARRRETRASSSSQSKTKVTTLTQEVAGLRSELASYKSQMSMLVQALSSSGIHLPGFSTPSPSQPFHTEQAQQSGPSTSDPVPYQQQDYQAPQNDMPIDFASLFS